MKEKQREKRRREKERKIQCQWGDRETERKSESGSAFKNDSRESKYDALLYCSI
jgi:hypothetical protein